MYPLLADEPPKKRETVIVTGTYDPLPLEEADRPVRSIDVRSISLVSNTFADLLKLDSSLDLRQRAPNGVQGDLSIRGGSFGQTLILLDGLRLNDVQSGHHNLDIPAPLEAISSIEILKGSGSTLYGSDAVGGVVNFITRAPESSEMRLRSAVGNFGTNQQRADLSYAASRWSEQLTFSRDFSTGFMPNRDYRNLSLASRTSMTTGSRNDGDHPCKQRSSFRRRAVLRELQFVGADQDMVRLRAAVSGQQDRCRLRIPAAHRPLRPLPRSAVRLHESSCR